MDLKDILEVELKGLRMDKYGQMGELSIIFRLLVWVVEWMVMEFFDLDVGFFFRFFSNIYKRKKMCIYEEKDYFLVENMEERVKFKMEVISLFQD